MPCTLFPQEHVQLAAMERCLQKANLLQVHQTIEQLTDLSQKTGNIAQAAFSSGLFEAAMRRTEELGDQEICLNHQICHLREEVNDLMIEKDRLDPEQIAKRLDDLQQKIFSCIRPCTQSLRQELCSLENQWRHLNFLYIFPVAEELNPDSFFSNYFHRISREIDECRKSDPERAKMLQTTLRDLQKESLAAEQLFCGKGLRHYRQLPHEIQLAVQQRLFAFDPNFSIKEALGPKELEILVGAIMADLADRMIL